MLALSDPELAQRLTGCAGADPSRAGPPAAGRAHLILPGATVGVLGGGQLGRMFVLRARAMGYRTAVLDPDPVSPAGTAADLHLRAAYTDPAALDRLASECDAVTTEFENVPAEALERLAGSCRVRPPVSAVAVTQERVSEKQFLERSGFPTAPFARCATSASCTAAVARSRSPRCSRPAAWAMTGRARPRWIGRRMRRRPFGRSAACLASWSGGWHSRPKSP